MRGEHQRRHGLYESAHDEDVRSLETHMSI